MPIWRGNTSRANEARVPPIAYLVDDWDSAGAFNHHNRL
jgi:hypothetical protein